MRECARITINIWLRSTSHNDAIFVWFADGEYPLNREILLSGHTQKRVELLVQYGLLNLVHTDVEPDNVIVYTFEITHHEFDYMGYLNIPITPYDYHSMGGTGGMPWYKYYPGDYDFRDTLYWRMQEFRSAVANLVDPPLIAVADFIQLMIDKIRGIKDGY